MHKKNDKTLTNDCLPASIRLRNAEHQDKEQVFQWRNDPWLISESPGLGNVDWEDHVRWFAEVLDAGSHLLFIVESEDGTGMGTVRLDKAGKDRAIITIHLLQPYVGQGFGAIAIREACNAGFGRWLWMKSIHAYIRKDNLHSLRAFGKARFTIIHRKDDAIFILTEMVLRRAARLGGSRNV